MDPDPVYTAGTARGAKLASLLIDVGTALVRKILEDEVQKINPPCLRNQLKNQEKRLCKLPFRFFNAGQREKLYPRRGDVPDSAQGFDISLLEFLLKEVYGNAPHAGPRNRLRKFKNSHYGHNPSTALTEEEFEKLWKELADILVDLGGNREKISEGLSWSIDPEQEAKYFDLLQQMFKEENEVKDLVLAQGESQKKRQEELKSLLVQVRDNQRPTTGSEQTESSDETEDVITCLRDQYATEYAHVRPLPWCEDLCLHLEEVYTSLQLQVKDSRGRFKDTHNIVSLADIYKTCEGNDDKANVSPGIRKIRVEGPPGIGKSCSCQKLAYDWSSGKLGTFKAVFFLEMRHLVGKVKDEIFEQLLPKDIKTTPDQLWSYIKENQDDVLFILDGLDELSQKAREVTDVVDLIQGKILRNCHVLVTSRPYHCVKDLEKCHQFYGILGYSFCHSVEFIRKYFCKSPESTSRLERQLYSNRNLLEIVVNPLNNVLICVVWEDNNEELPSNKAELYGMIVLSVAKRFCTKRDLPMESDKLPPDIKEALRGLGKLSWEGLEQEQLQFNIDEITKNYDTSADNMLNMGLLTRDYSFSRIKRTCYCAFLHKTFQEYMAAYYISELVMDECRRNEGMECLRGLFGLTKATDNNKESILASLCKYGEVQNALPLILGEKVGPLFHMFAEELNKAERNADKKCLSFVCIMLLGATCAGDKMAEIVLPYLSQYITNNLGDLSEQYEDHTNWLVGLTHVLTAQKKLAVSQNNPRFFVQYLSVNCSLISTDPAQQDKLDMLENTLSDYEKMCSVTLLETRGSSRADFPSFFPLRTFIPKRGTASVSIHLKPRSMSHLSLSSSLGKLSEAPMIKHVTITTECVGSEFAKRDADFSEYDRLLGQMIARQSCLRTLRLTLHHWLRIDPETRGYGNLTATLQSISNHAGLEVLEFNLPGSDTLLITKHTRVEVVRHPYNNMEMVRFTKYEAFDVEPMINKLTECLNKNKVLKTLRLGWVWSEDRYTRKFYYGVYSTQSLSNLCSAILRNRTLETLEINGMLSQSKRKAVIVAKLMRSKPSNYKKLRITMIDQKPVDDTVMLPRALVSVGPIEHPEG